MSSLRRSWLWLAAVAAAARVIAQPAASVPPPPPPLPSAPSPVEIFRELLAQPADKRKELLTNRPPETQRRLLAKLCEYELLPPADREVRLRATELRWYLLPLLRTPPAARAAPLTAVPAALRPAIESRLREWDKLAAADQQELLENEATLDYLTQLQTGTEAQQQAVRQNLSPARREKLEAGIAAWRGQPAAQRDQLLARFNQFFDLTPAEKARALDTFSEAERQQMEKTLGRFAKLPKAQREQCVRSFAQFTAMSLDERQQFLKNAERWRLMSPAERQQWRELVQKIPAPPLPPLPPAVTPRFPPPPLTMATNKS